MDEFFVLIRYQDSWADEIDIDELMVTCLSKETYLHFLKALGFLKVYDKKISFYIGTNQEMEYENGKHFLEKLEVYTISGEEYDTFEKFGLTERYILFDKIVEPYEKWEKENENKES